MTVEIKNKFKISIITPSYNQGDFIEKAIQSVINQGEYQIEHIIIDGDSSDKTIDILKKYPHLIYISEKDEGQSDALNKGFAMATGDIIGWLNSDDYYEPGCFDKIIESLNSNRVDAVYGDYRFVDINGNETRKLITQLPVKWISLFYCFIPSTTFFFKRKIYDSGIKIDKKIHISMDKEFFAKILFNNFNIKKIDSILANFRWHSNNKSIDTNEIKRIRYKEGLMIFNRFSKITLPNNIYGTLVYNLLSKIIGFYRLICRTFKIHMYKN